MSANYDAIKHHVIAFIEKSWSVPKMELIKMVREKFKVDFLDAYRAYRDAEELKGSSYYASLSKQERLVAVCLACKHEWKNHDWTTQKCLKPDCTCPRYE